MNTLMIFAAGFGTRMKHLTEDTPKPLVKVNDKPILYYSLDAATSQGFNHIIINSHYKAEQIKAAVDHYIDIHPDCPKITLLYEDTILETGGAVKNALSLIDSEYIVTINSDVIIHSNKDFFCQMEEAWNPKVMDFLFLVHKTDKAIGYTGKGDFEMSESGELILRPPNLEYYRYMNAGAQVFKTALIKQNSKQIFPLNEYYHGNYKLHGIENDGLWCHLSCPEDLEKIERALQT